MQYIIKEVLGDYEAQYGKRRVDFKVEGNTNKISGFFKFVPQVGDSLDGEIVANGQYWNFKFPSKVPRGNVDSDLTNRKLDAIWTKLGVIEGLLKEHKF